MDVFQALNQSSLLIFNCSFFIFPSTVFSVFSVPLW